MSDETNEKPKTEETPEDVTAGVPQTNELLPVCPHCGADPMQPTGTTYGAGTITLLFTMCANCRKPVPASILDKRQPRIQMPNNGGGPRILRPQ